MYFRKQQRKKEIAIISIAVLLVFYFVFHAFSGKKGVFALSSMQKELLSKSKQLEEKRAKRIEIEHRVNLLKSDSLDLDILEEQVKKNLGFSKKNEKIYDMSKKKKK